MMTTAETISSLLHDDGQCFEADDGRTLDDLVQEHGARTDWMTNFAGDPVRHTFKDGSVITVAGDGWDFGYGDCYCWRGVGHVVDLPDGLATTVEAETHADAERAIA